MSSIAYACGIKSSTDSSVIFQLLLIWSTEVIGDDGFCFIGATDECVVKGSRLDNRGGIQSIEHNEIIYRVKYSGADSPLERFSVTSVDQISSNWNITLESTDDFIPQAYAMEDIHLKVKYRTISDLITVMSGSFF